MKVKTSNLTGSALDWAVARCEGVDKLAASNKEMLDAFEELALIGDEGDICNQIARAALAQHGGQDDR